MDVPQIILTDLAEEDAARVASAISDHFKFKVAPDAAPAVNRWNIVTAEEFPPKQGLSARATLIAQMAWFGQGFLACIRILE